MARDFMRVAGWTLIAMGAYLLYDGLKPVVKYFLLISQEPPRTDKITKRARVVFSFLFIAIGGMLLLYSYFAF